MVRIGFLGDLILSPELDIDQYLLSELQGTDLNIANLEAPFIHNSILSQGKRGGLHQLTDSAEMLHELNVKCVSLANNHMFDFGLAGFEHTIDLLEHEGIGYFGAGRNLEEAIMFKDIRVKESSIAFAGYVSRYLTRHHATKEEAGIAPFINTYVYKALTASSAKMNILYLHLNQEFENYPQPLFLYQAKQLIRSVDCIVGSHPHCIQGVSEVNGRYIFHSLGNFSIPHAEYSGMYLREYPEHCYEAFFMVLSMENGSFPRTEIIPYIIENGGKKLVAMDKERRINFHSHLDAVSKATEKEYREYKRFYTSNKIRKFRPTLRKNHQLNKILVFGSSFLIRSIGRISVFIARILDVMGLRSFVRSRFSFVLKRIFKL